jgi:Ricin-type beta-trefoil lectin domain-like
VAGKTAVHKIENRNSGLVLDDVDGRKDAPAPVKQYGCWGDDGRQQWKLIRIATNTSGQPATTQPARIASGQTLPGQGWQQHTDDGVRLDVDTSSAKFSGTPTYVISLSGPGGSMWVTTGGSSAVYDPTPTGFRVFLKRADGQPLPVKTVTDDYKWYVNWIGVEE